jgi:hypothetical protein
MHPFESQRQGKCTEGVSQIGMRPGKGEEPEGKQLEKKRGPALEPLACLKVCPPNGNCSSIFSGRVGGLH